MAKKTDFQKAAEQFKSRSGYVFDGGMLSFSIEHSEKIRVREMADGVLRLTYGDWSLPLGDREILSDGPPGSVGKVCKFIEDGILHARGIGVRPLPKLKGAASANSFEDLLMKDAKSLEKKGVLTMGRYPVASVMIAGSSRPMQVPSLPDFEGVFPDGSQFIFEAKVCSDGAFRIVKDKIKPKQVDHLVKRSRFNVLTFIMFHFNERLTATMYEPPVTVAFPVSAVDKGGDPMWEAYASDKKGTYVRALPRAEVLAGGVEVSWHLPPRATVQRPNLQALFEKIRPTRKFDGHNVVC